MKKIAALLALVLCVMMATTAMAERSEHPDGTFYEPATAKNPNYATKEGASDGGEHNSASDIGSILNQFQSVFKPASEQMLEDDVEPETTPYSDYENDPNKRKQKLYNDVQQAMSQALSSYFTEDELVQKVFLICEAEAFVKMQDGENSWHYMQVGSDTDRRVWADRVTGTISYDHFGGQVKKVKALYADVNIAQGGVLQIKIDDAGATITDDGVEVSFDHLSPVMIAWTLEPVAAPLEAPDMPSTGDSSSLPGLFILLGLSIAAMGAMKLRRREN